MLACYARSRRSVRDAKCANDGGGAAGAKKTPGMAVARKDKGKRHFLQGLKPLFQFCWLRGS